MAQRPRRTPEIGNRRRALTPPICSHVRFSSTTFATLGTPSGAARTVVGMTTTDDVTPIRVSGPAGLLAVVPTMLGFHPSNSLVLMCLSGERRRVGPVARVDLPPGHDRPLAARLTMHALNHADEVVVISYQTTAAPSTPAGRPAGRPGPGGCRRHGRHGGARRASASPALNAAMERAHPGIPVPDADDPAGQRAGRGRRAGRARRAGRPRAIAPLHRRADRQAAATGAAMR